MCIDSILPLPPWTALLRKEIEEKLETLKNVRGELSNKELQLREREKELDAREKQLVSMKRVGMHRIRVLIMMSCVFM